MAKKTKSSEDVPQHHQDESTVPAATIEPPAEAPAFEIPGAPRLPVQSLDRSMIWITGPPKIGKTSLAASFPGAWFFATEPGQDWVSVRKPANVQSWDHFLEICAKMESDRPAQFGDGTPITHLVIDTVDLLFKMCKDQLCLDLGIEDPSDNEDRGKTWNKLSSEFERVITKMRRWPYGLICISHTVDKEYKSKGTKKQRATPDIGAGGYRVLWSAADIIMYCYTDEVPTIDDEGTVTGAVEEKRMALMHPQSWAVAGGRMAHLYPTSIPLSYDALMEPFKQLATTPPPTPGKKK